MVTDQNKAKSIFLQAVEIASAAERQAYLQAECKENEVLRREIEALLRHHERIGEFLESGAHGLPVTTAAPPLMEGPGTRIGPYKLLEQIGEGGMGLVFVAEQQQPVRRKVALKLIKPGMDSRQVIARFEAERQALSIMDHPNIAKVLDGGATPEGRPYFVMDLVKGTPITDYCDRNQLGTRQRLELFRDVCQAVQHAHQKGIIHRDLKPSNVLVEVHDVRPVVKIIDFGIAKAIGQQLTDKTLHTGIAQMIGTPLYMSPEQAGLSSLDVDTRSDVYALGVLLYELLTGTTPFDGETLKKAGYDEMRRIVREDEPPKPSARLSTMHDQMLSTLAEKRGMEPRKLGQQMRGELDLIVMKALEKDRNRRYESASALAADVQRYLADEPVEACPPSRRYRLGKVLRKHRTRVLTATVLLAAAVALAAGLGWVARDQAVRQAVIEAEVRRALKEVQRLQDQARWSQALEIARQTQTLLESGSSDEVLRQQVRERVNDLRMVLRLEEIRSTIFALTAGTSQEIERADSDYRKAFQEYGLDVNALRPEEAAASIQAKSVRLELAQALDNWARVRRGDKNNSRDWKRLNAIVRAADPDAWRNRFRQAWESGDKKELEKLIASANVDELLPGSMVLWALDLRDADRAEQAIAFLWTAQRRHPDNLRINQELAWLLLNSSPPRTDEAIRYYSSSVAIRPDFPRFRLDVGGAFFKKGELDEAIANFREAIRLKPDYPLAYTNISATLYKLKKLPEAKAAYRKAIVLTEQELDKLRSRLGSAHPDTLDSMSELVYMYTELGDMLRDQHKPREAEAAFHKAIDLEPTHPLPYMRLERMLIEQQRLREVETLVSDLIERARGNRTGRVRPPSSGPCTT